MMSQAPWAAAAAACSLPSHAVTEKGSCRPSPYVYFFHRHRNPWLDDSSRFCNVLAFHNTGMVLHSQGSGYPSRNPCCPGSSSAVHPMNSQFRLASPLQQQWLHLHSSGDWRPRCCLCGLHILASQPSSCSSPSSTSADDARPRCGESGRPRHVGTHRR